MQIVTESDLTKAVELHLSRRKSLACSQVKVGPSRFDVVAYDKNERLFRVVECKLHSRPSSVGRTFGQVVSYQVVLASVVLNSSTRQAESSTV
jgi:NDP-sugar pyrophosphorylase family protein